MGTLIVTLLGLALVGDGEPFALADKDRVAWVGDGLVEREQLHGFLETALQSRYVDRRLTFRNLGWNADTPAGVSRTIFDPPSTGPTKLAEQVRAVQPTVLFVSYGTASSFDGPGGLKRFRSEFDQLLSTLKLPAERTLLFTPPPHEQKDPPFPDAGPHNRDLSAYAASIAELAGSKQTRSIDLFTRIGSVNVGRDLTDDGIQFNELGYWVLALEIERELGFAPRIVDVELHVGGKVQRAVGAKVQPLHPAGDRFRFAMTDDRLPTVAPASASGVNHPQRGSYRLRVTGLPAGQFTLTSGSERIRTASAREWADGLTLTQMPQHRQAEALREVIRRKDRLYFHRFRPQNITYLLLFRQHEQGQNAREIGELDAPIADLEAKIHDMKKPRPVEFQLLFEGPETP